MSVAITQANIDPIQAVSRFFNSEQFFALGTTLLLHLMVVALLLAGWVASKPAEPITKAIKVQMFVMPAAAPHVKTAQAQPTPAPLQQATPKKAVAEAPFAKKRVEETPNIESKKFTEPIASENISEKMENAALASAENSETIQTDTTKTDTSKTAANTESSESAAASTAEKNFDVSQYTPVKKEAPVYPQRALDKGLQGSCTVEYMVNTQGLVENPVALSDCHAFFIKPSLEATKSFRYSPRMLDGKAVNVSNVKNTFQYRIE